MNNKFWDGKKVFNFGLALIFIGLGVQMALGEIGLYFGSICSTAGILLAFKGHLMQKNPEKLKKDERLKKIGVKGVMIGRAAVINPSIFDELKGNKVPSFEELKKEYSLLAEKYNSKPRYKKNVLMRIGRNRELKE